MARRGMFFPCVVVHLTPLFVVVLSLLVLVVKTLLR